jgi:PAS domain S-box-containing protein
VSPGGAVPHPSSVHAERLFALSQDLLGAAGPDGRLTWVNDAWERMLGWPPETLLRRSYLEFVDAADRSRIAELAERLAQAPHGRSVEIEVRVRARDGSRRWLRFSVAVAAGEQRLVYLSGKDVTDLRRRTEELERSNAELERFASVVSHDLRQPLFTVSGFLQLLERRHGDALDEPGRELIELALEGSRRMAGLLEDLLAYARVGASGRAPVPVDTGEALDAAIAEVRSAPSGPDVAREGSFPVVLARPHEFRQLVVSLLTNAVKFVPEDRRPVVRVRARPEAGGWCFEVADNGVGVAAEDAKRIFGVFERVRSTAAPGTGLGLAIAQKVVEQAGGRIWVRPAPEGGSVFAFTWPQAG